MEAIIFDFGGVLCFHPSDEQIEGMAVACGVSRDAFLDAYWGSRIEYDRGDFSPEEYWRRFGEKVGRTYSAAQVEDFRRRDVEFWLSLDGRMMRWVREMKVAGIKLGLISNLPVDLGEYLRRETDLFSHFDHVTLSYELRVVKPDAAIYLECCEGLGVAPEDALFLDDRQANVEGADAAGLKGVLFESPDQLSAELRGMYDILPFGTPPIAASAEMV
jgi:putative hydrolase of the HAD superfamily